MTAPPSAQLRPLLQLRWTMVRSPHKRAGLVALIASFPLLLIAGAVIARLLPPADRLGILLVTPTVMLGFVLLAFAAPIAAGGGNELYPSEQLVAYPIRPRTQFVASLLLAPLNLAWVIQVLTLVGFTSYVFLETSFRILPALLTMLGFIVVVTLVAQAFAWAIVGVRQSRTGRLVTWGAAALLAGAVTAAVVSGQLARLLDQNPLRFILVLALQAAEGRWLLWLPGASAMVAVGAAAFVLGSRACAWTLRRRPDAGLERSARPLARRPIAGDAFSQLVRTDRASVWRSTALRRGIYVLALLPAVVAAAVGLDWTSLILLPGLVAAGAGLLFGVNAFCLDGSGALWLSSLPHPASLAFWAKTRVLLEVCGGAVLVALVAGGARAGGLPTATQLATAVGSAAACSLMVTASYMGLSVRSPHRADLRGSRDTPAPPAAMAAYSVRLAALTTFTGIGFSVLTFADNPALPLVLMVALGLLAVRRLLIAERLYRSPEVRSRVAATVAAG
ncbi:MAG TPA: hypothetical protein VEV13_02040 [Candidatus Limnocylindria bacterium]|nr:hypothetical protein [Candidatus Limnocylindria bacterium]